MAAPGGRNPALNHAAWLLGHRIAAGVVDQADVKDALYAAVLANGLVADDASASAGLRPAGGAVASLRLAVRWAHKVGRRYSEHLGEPADRGRSRLDFAALDTR